MQVYSHSYLGLGLQAARQAVLQLDNGGDVSGGGPVISSCMTTQTPKEWSFQGKTFQISTRSQQQGGSSHELCKQSVKQILADVHRPEEIKVYIEDCVFLRLSEPCFGSFSPHVGVENSCFLKPSH